MQALEFLQFESCDLIILDDFERLLEVDDLWNAFKNWINSSTPRFILISIADEFGGFKPKELLEMLNSSIKVSIPPLKLNDRQMLFSFFLKSLQNHEAEMFFITEIPKVSFSLLTYA
jgi:hypothetical protein